MRREQKQLPEREISFFDGAVARSAPREGGQGEGTARKQRPGSPRFITALTTSGEFATYFQPLLLFPSFFFFLLKIIIMINPSTEKPPPKKTQRSAELRATQRAAQSGAGSGRTFFPSRYPNPSPTPTESFPILNNQRYFQPPGPFPALSPEFPSEKRDDNSRRADFGPQSGSPRSASVGERRNLLRLLSETAE